MKKILVIEDEPEMRRNILTILKMERFDATGAENGRVGVELAKKLKPDLILCDVMMPELNGYDVLKALREDETMEITPFIFLTAKGEKADQRAGMALGADDYLTKPVAKADLLSAITARLERRAAFEQRIHSLRQHMEPKFELSSPEPLQTLGLTRREAEVLFWVAQGKTNAEIGMILGMSDRTADKHLEHIFPKLGVETRSAAALRALEVLSRGS